ncbi:MAG: histidine kinase, partial [Angelakisella sp.]
TAESDVLWSAFPMDHYMERAMQEPWYTCFDPVSRQVECSALHFLNSKNGKSNPLVTCKQNIYDINNPTRKIGEIMVHMSVENLQKNLQPIFEATGETVLFNRKTDEIICKSFSADTENQAAAYLAAAPADFIDNPSGTRPFGDGYITWKHLDSFGWSILTYCSRQDMTAETGTLILFFCFFIPLTVLVSGFACSIIIRTLMQPLGKLSDAMQHFAEGDMETRVQIDTGDEFEQLSERFNEMVLQIDSLMRKQRDDEKIRKKFEFDMLMSRIHPHFLYNTLHSATYLAGKAGAEDCVQMLRALILMLQDGMGIYDDRICDTLEHEIAIVDAYCLIQNYRYKDKFQITYELSPEAMQATLAKNILQPLVENSIFHGIAPMSENGLIELSAEVVDGHLQIYLCDNGVGMDEATLNRLRTGSASSGASSVHAIAVQSIRDRLEYLYPREYVFEVYSEVGKGTTWNIELPYQRGDKSE